MTRRTTDLFLTGPTGLSSPTNNILTSTGAAIDTMNAGAGLPDYRSFYVQVNGSAGISAGVIVFEGSNDNTNFVVLGYVDGSAVSGNVTAAGVSIAASTSRFFQGPIPFRYFRARISTAFTGGTISATARLSTTPYASGIVQVGQLNSSNLKAIVIPTPQGSGGNAMSSAAVTNTASTVKAGPGQVYGWDFHNPNAAIVYVQFFNTASPTVGTTTPVMSVGIPANGTKTAQWPHGVAFGTAIVIAATTTRTGSTAPGSAVDANVIYT